MIRGCRIEHVQHYLICHMEAKVKAGMASTDLEYEISKSLVDKLLYFDRKVELYGKLIDTVFGEDDEWRQTCRRELHRALDNNEAHYATAKLSWSWK